MSVKYLSDELRRIKNTGEITDICICYHNIFGWYLGVWHIVKTKYGPLPRILYNAGISYYEREEDAIKAYNRLDADEK